MSEKFKPKVESDQAVETSKEAKLGLTPEKQEYYHELIKPDYMKFERKFSFFERNVTWSEFIRTFPADPPASAEKVQSRKLWLEIKKEGDAFRIFFENEIRKVLNAPAPDTYLLFRYIQISVGLGKESIPFLREVLSHRTVWNCTDGSMKSKILDFFGRIQDPENADTIIIHIKHILSKEYVRGARYRESDLAGDIESLVGSVGWGRAKRILRALIRDTPESPISWEKVKENLTWIKKNTGRGSWAKIEFEPFDYERELGRIKELKMGGPMGYRVVPAKKDFPHEKRQKFYRRKRRQSR